MKKKIAHNGARIVLGAIMFIFGFNKLYLFIPVPEQDTAGKALMTAIISSGYLIYAVAVVEIAAGLLLLLGRYLNVAYLMLLPVTTNILLFHLFADQRNLLAGLLVFGLNFYLIITRRAVYAALLQE